MGVVMDKLPPVVDPTGIKFLSLSLSKEIWLCNAIRVHCTAGLPDAVCTAPNQINLLLSGG